MGESRLQELSSWPHAVKCRERRKACVLVSAGLPLRFYHLGPKPRTVTFTFTLGLPSSANNHDNLSPRPRTSHRPPCSGQSLKLSPGERLCQGDNRNNAILSPGAFDSTHPSFVSWGSAPGSKPRVAHFASPTPTGKSCSFLKNLFPW